MAKATIRAACTRPSKSIEPRLVLLLTFAATAFTAIVFWGSPRFRDANAPPVNGLGSLRL